MTSKRKITDKNGVQVFPITHTKAVVDDNGNSVEQRLQENLDLINQKQLEVGAVPSDITPTEGSTNWVTSGGVFDYIMQSGVFDLSAYNSGDTYADLSAALTALNALDSKYKYGGMSFKFVQSSDNKYVQYRLTATSFSTNENDWTEGGGGDGVYDISENNGGATYIDLAAALGTNGANVPTSNREGGMSVKFIQNIYATYSVVKTEGLEIEPTGTELQSASAVMNGVYTAAQLSDFNTAATLPSTVNSSVTYYFAVTTTEIIDEQEVTTTTYTKWVVTKATNDSGKYVQWRYIGTSIANSDFVKVADWQGVDNEPTADSDNLVKSGGVYNSTPTILNSSAELDLDISDEQGNVLMRLANGHIQVKNFASEDVLDSIQAILSNIGFDNIPEFNEEEDYAIGEIVRYGKLVYVFTSAHEAGGWDASDVEETVITTEHPVEVINSSSGADLDISDEQGNTLAEFKNGGIKTKNFDSSKVPQKRFLPYQRRTYFAQSVNTFNYLTTDFVAESINSYDAPVYYNDNVVLYLPTSYSVDGNPTKLIIYCKHGASTIEPSSDDILTGSMGSIFRYMLHLGYGILAADGVPNDWATAKKLGERVVGNYVAVESTIRAFEYVKEKYNIDHDNVYIFGYSQGGHYAQNVIDNSNIPIAAAAELSPVCSMRYHQWDLSASGTVDGVSYTKLARLNIARIFDFPAVANNTELLALEYDPAKTVGYDPWNRNVENIFTGFEKNSSDLWVLPNSTSLDDITMKKHIRCPLKIWAANNDNVLGIDVMKVFIKAVKNSGQAADLQLYTSGAHNIPTVQSSIGTFTENGDTCNLYPIAVDIASWFFNFGGYSLI